MPNERIVVEYWNDKDLWVAMYMQGEDIFGMVARKTRLEAEEFAHEWAIELGVPFVE